jgi:hypothetical protein
VACWREEFEREHREQFEELTLLQTQGYELCLAIVGPPRVRNHLSEGMQISTSLFFCSYVSKKYLDK